MFFRFLNVLINFESYINKILFKNLKYLLLYIRIISLFIKKIFNKQILKLLNKFLNNLKIN